MYSSEQTSEFSDEKQNWIGKYVLIVEDTIDNYLYLKVLLKGFELNLIHASTAMEAMELYHANPQISLVLMDLQLPDDSGLNVTRVLKKVNPNLIVVAQTAFAMADDERDCMEAGCDDYLSKPISSVSLMRVMKKHLG